MMSRCKPDPIDRNDSISMAAGSETELFRGTAEQLRVDADLEDRDEGSGGLLEGFSGEWDEGSEQSLQPLEGLRNAVVVGRGQRRITPFALCGEGHEDAERVLWAELLAF